MKHTLVLLPLMALTGCAAPPAQSPASAPTSTVASASKLSQLGTVEVTAKLVELPNGAIIKRDLYDYATILKYEVVSVQRGKLKKGDVIYVGHYNPWKPRSEVADKHIKNIGGTLRKFQAGALHHMALEVPMDDHFMGGIVDRYFGKYTGDVYWAVWTNAA